MRRPTVAQVEQAGQITAAVAAVKLKTARFTQQPAGVWRA